jgi:hypothetical protein
MPSRRRLEDFFRGAILIEATGQKPKLSINIAPRKKVAICRCESPEALPSKPLPYNWSPLTVSITDYYPNKLLGNTEETEKRFSVLRFAHFDPRSQDYYS